MRTNDLKGVLRNFASDYPVLRVMCDLMAEFGQFDRALVAVRFGASTPRTLRRFSKAGLIEGSSRRIVGESPKRIYYKMPRHLEIRRILDAASN